MYDKETKIVKCKVNSNNPAVLVIARFILQELKDEGLLMQNEEYLQGLSTALTKAIDDAFDFLEKADDETVKKYIGTQAII